MRRGLVIVLLWLVAPAAQAHPLAPAMLELSHVTGGEYEVLWRTSTQRRVGIEVAPLLPSDCIASGVPRTALVDAQTLEARWRAHCAGDSIAGKTIGVTGLPGSGINAIVRVAHGDDVATTILDGTSAQWVVPQVRSTTAVFGEYLELGVGHLLSGWDHLLFVTALLLLLRGTRRLLVTVTAFTLGHSLTLAAATLGWVRFDARLMEFGIAASLLVLAVELARPATAAPSWLLRRPWQLAAAFGLLHGFGFAGALAEAGLPPGEIAPALLAFNLGIELGQVMLVLAWLICGLAIRRLQLGDEPWRRAWPAYAIGTVAASWCFERAFWVLG